ncbi:GAF and ANTAR domain-containing protein [Kribbella sp. CA-293567]|uniref:GAF and ANTAR domain-containing protein n=1 Tax=Kribbella sp. CA-293567 TaxID=3002436 RepID=UPI0022DD9452|nr:GAF and ANTAR domain-containing protein [Kribbella sp. CA-293567]WBQ03494.1 GAF and ANTAR domain-containing protein [Kribbella sp. CA-293567]
MDTVAETLTYPIDLDEALEQITRAAADTVPGIDAASISLTARNGQIETLAPTDPVAVALDEIQYALRQGPCLEAALREPWVQADDLANDHRWPVYGARAANEFGVHAQLAFQFSSETYARGALNLYANEPYGIGQETHLIGAMFARLAAVALGWSRHDETLSRALHSREQIGQAVGIIMERYRLDPDRAFAFLVRTSQAANTKLHHVAAALIKQTIDHAE